MPRRTPDFIPARTFDEATGQAVATIDDRDIYLGPYDSPGSVTRYKQEIMRWLGANIGETPQVAPKRSAGDGNGPTIAEVLAAYLRFAKTYDIKRGKITEDYRHVLRAIVPLRQLYDALPVVDFGPLKLKQVRELYVAAGQARTHVNSNVQRIKRIIRWAPHKTTELGDQQPRQVG